MKNHFLPLLFGTAALCFSALASAAPPDCESTTPVGSLCRMKVKNLHPTQFAVGSVAVECKKKKIEKKYRKGELEEYLADRSRHVPAVVGPDGKFYITDHHHLSTAVYRAKEDGWKGKKQKVYVSVLENYRDMDISQAKFWNIMNMQKYVWPYDEKDQEVGNYEAKLPEMDMGLLKDNPYRTLSRWTRESCGYVKAGKEQCVLLETMGDNDPTAPYFMEFYWAKFLREKLNKDNEDLDSPQELKDNYEEALQLTLNKDETTPFFSNQRPPLNAVEYGQNQKKKFYKLQINDDGCEEWYWKLN